jgi:hypothetical protein
MSIFSLGLFTIAAGVVRTAMILHTQFNPTDMEGPTQNLIWAAVEPCVALMVASLLVIKPLLVFMRHKCRSLISSLPYGSALDTKKSTNDSSAFSEQGKNRKTYTKQRNESEHELQEAEQGKIWQTTTTELHIDDREANGPSPRESAHIYAKSSVVYPG